jgi:hypothetical protein
MMLNEKALRIILGLLAAGFVAMCAIALYEWMVATDPTGSLAAVGVMATFAVAFAAVLALDQNRSLVKAATDEARASADAVSEMQRQREWSFKPSLAVSPGWRPTESNRFGVQFWRVRNIGTGPAFNVKLCGHRRPAGEGVRPSEWMAGECMGLAPNGEHEFVQQWQTVPHDSRPDRYRCLLGDWWQQEDDMIVAVRYEDWFGTHYRASPMLERPDEWRGHPSEAGAPDWLRCS